MKRSQKCKESTIVVTDNKIIFLSAYKEDCVMLAKS